jgi:hypothetical protein
VDGRGAERGECAGLDVLGLEEKIAEWKRRLRGGLVRRESGAAEEISYTLMVLYSQWSKNKHHA